ncbi:MAG: hypothetical protein ACP5T3_01355 [Candidatus Micrarchaeia archaeon]
MLYVKALSLDRFKSFKHASLLFSKGFNAIVGPNGSGKSNICDALLFSLGESSLHRLRASRLEDLIQNKSGKSSASKAYVRLELDGDEHIELTRWLSSDGKSKYRVNGKHMTRQEVLELLGAHALYADERNTVAQGEIGRITELNSKERRELIDAAAGIKEFEQKKEEALRELDKVNMKISEMQGIFQERLGFLKELEKEKAAAESYAAMTTRLRQLNYSMLLARITITQSAIESYQKDMSVLQAEKNKEEAEAKRLSDALAAANAERQALTKKIEDSTKEASSVNESLQEINSRIAEASAKINAYTAKAEEKEKEIQEQRQALKRAEEQMRANADEIERLAKRLAELEKNLPSAKGYDLANVKALDKKLAELESSKKALEDELAALDKNQEGARTKIESLNSKIDELEKEKAAAYAEIADLDKQANAANADAASYDSEIKALEGAMPELKRKLDEASTMMLELKEQKAMAVQRSSGIEEALRKAFGKNEGFYGTIASLCEYAPEYAVAIEAAAGARMGYFVVDTLETASAAIEYIKQKGLGRATFIPLSDIRVARAKSIDAKPLLSVVSFDKKFEKAFEFVFGNTYIVGSLQEAKKLGIGECRYVTLSGELVESSGLVSGGSNAKRQVVQLATVERQLKELDETMTNLSKEQQLKNERLFELRKAAASADTRLRMLAESRKKAASKIAEIESQIKSARETIAAESGNAAKADAKRNQLENAIKEISQSIASARRDLEMAYAALGSGNQETQASAEAASAQKEVEKVKIAVAELNKENQLLANMKEEAAKAIEKAEREKAEAENAADAEKKEMQEQEKKKSSIEERARNASQASKLAYDRISELENTAMKISKQLGESSGSMREIDAKLNDAQIKGSQLEVRLNDLKAELAAYEQGIQAVKGMSIDEMEKEANVLSAKISDLGTVNMKAPEVYALRKKEVDEAQEKLDTLETERRSVLNLIDEVDKKKLAAFMSTFNEIDKNFGKMYSYVFPGNAKLELDNYDDPFSGGLEIKITNTNQQGRLVALSGGEKALVSLMLLFAIHTYRPASVYIFDEIDAALDKENSKKLSQLIKELSKNAQFIVVSHNDSLILNADAAIGVIKSEGLSKVVGVELSSLSNSNAKAT